MVSLLSSFYNGFKEFGHDIVDIINFFLLLIVYIFGVGPVSIIAKIRGKHFLDLKFRTKRSMWIDKEPIKDKDEYYRQF